VRSRDALARALGEPCLALSYPFGAAAEREFELAREAGYEAAFTLAPTWDGDSMAIPRTPVYLWSPPVPVVGRLAVIERFGATLANRCAVGTSILQRASSRILVF
jgi:hypothetical protein